jgi:TPR repeat protein
MDSGFIDILKLLVAEQGKTALFDLRQSKALLTDYAKNEYKKETRLFLQGIEAGAAKALVETDDLEPCKKKYIRELDDDYALDTETAEDIVNTLALILRGDTTWTASPTAAAQTTPTVSTTPNSYPLPPLNSATSKPDDNTAGMSAKEIYNLGVAADKAKDFAKGAALYLKAAEMGYMYAQNDIAFCYREGSGVQQDYAKAFYWFEKSAAQGFAKAMSFLGYCYDAEQGVKQDKTKAFYWYTKAAEKGQAISMRNVGIFYRDGISVKQDFAKAKQWFKKAIAAGDEGAKSELAKLKEMRRK